MTDTVNIELPREVAERWAGDEHLYLNEDTPIVKACRKALTNPTRSDESELRSAADCDNCENERWVDAGGWGKSKPCPKCNPNGAAKTWFDKQATALSQTQGGAQPIPEAKSHDYPLIDLDRALEVVERVKAFVGGDIDPELASVGTILADLDNLSLCLKLAAGKVDNPPPTATGEGSQSVSEGVDGDAIRLIESALLKADDELRNGAAHRDAFAILSAAMNQLRALLVATNQPSPEDGGWQPIETAPKDGSWIQLWGATGVADEPEGWAIGYWCGGIIELALTGEEAVWVTHWMPLPTPPSEGSES